MKKYAFRIFYLGDKFQGFQRQPNGFGVENFLEYAFIASDCITSFKSNNYRNASRTDTGVNALSNVVSMFSRKEPNLNQLNSFLGKDKELIIYQYKEVPPDFNPRKNSFKIYEYYIPHHLEIYNIARSHEYEGTHDFSPFIRSGGAGEHNPITSIKSVEVIRKKNWKILRITGDSFGREQIRRMVGLLMERKYTKYHPQEILEKQKMIPIRSAPAQYLVLHDVIYEPSMGWIPMTDMSYYITKLSNRITRNSDFSNLKANLISQMIQLLQSSNLGQ